MIETYIITIKGHKHSEYSSRICQEAFRKHNSHLGLQVFDAVTPTTLDDALKKLDMRWAPDKKVMSRSASPSKGACAVSHITLWNKVMQENKPLLILEHDDYAVRPFTKEDYESAMDSRYSFISLKEIEREQFFDGDEDGLWQPTTCMAGGHCALVKPAGAKMIIDFIMDYYSGDIPAHNDMLNANRWPEQLNGFACATENWFLNGAPGMNNVSTSANWRSGS